MDATLATPLAVLPMQRIRGGYHHRFRLHLVQHLLRVTKPGGRAKIKSRAIQLRIGNCEQLRHLRHAADGLNVPATDQACAKYRHA